MTLRHPRPLPPQGWAANHLDDAPLEERFKPPTNRPHWSKPAHGTGLWTSTLVDNWTPWLEWCRGEEYGADRVHLWRLEVDPEARVIEVDSLADLMAVIARYACKQYGDDYPQLLADHYVIDFEAMARDDVAGIHLTDEGEAATRFAVETNLGWDCESTLWLRWAFTLAEYLDEVTVHTQVHSWT